MGVLHAMYEENQGEQTLTCISRASTADMHHVWRIVYHAYSTYIPLLEKTPPTFMENFDRHVSLGNLWLCRAGGEVVAMVVLTPNRSHLMIQALCVDPSFQGLGLGRRMLAFAETQALEGGFRSLRLYTNSIMERNIRIYERWGFLVDRIETYPWGERVHMSKNLVQPGRTRVRVRKTNASLEAA